MSRPYQAGPAGGGKATYDASQKQRALEREIRKHKRQLAASLTPKTATAHRAKIRSLQAQIRTLIDKHPKLQRLPYRERATTPAPKTRPQSQTQTHTPTRHTTIEDPLYKLEKTMPGSVPPGRVTIPEGMSKPPEPHEISTAHRLAAHGVDVEFRKEAHGYKVKNPDVMMFGEIWEFKSPEGGGRDTISKQFRRAKSQSSRLVIDLARCKLDDGDATSQIIRRFLGQSRIQKLIIVDKRNRLKVLRHSDIMSA